MTVGAAQALPFESDLASVLQAVGEADWSGLRGKRIFLTGGTGFVGKWLLATLLHADRALGLGCRVTVLSRNPQAFVASAPLLAGAPQVTLLQGDVRDFALPTETFDCVIHAATDVVATATPLETFDTCVLGTRRVLDLAVQSRCSRVLLVSSGAMYGRQPAELPGVPETYTGGPDVADPRSAYGEGKRVTEWLGAAYAHQHGLDVRVARCFAFVGPYLPLDKHFALGNFLRDAMADQAITIQGDGTAQRTYLYAADMAAWLWAILLRGALHGTYNVGGDEIVSVGQLAARIAGAIGSASAVRVLGRATAGMAPDRYAPDNRKALTELRLPPPVALDDAIRRTADWHRQAYPA